MVIGSLNADFVVRAPRRPAPGETLFGREFRIYPGGKGANQAVAASRAGGSVFMAGRTGDDIFSSVVTSTLKDAGVDCTHVMTSTEEATGSAFIVVDNAGENAILVVPGANRLVTRADVDALTPLLGKCSVLLLQLEIPIDTTAYAAEVAQRLGVFVMLDPAPAQAIPEDLYPRLDAITPNEHEASLLTGMHVSHADSARAAVSNLLGKGTKQAIVKLGGKGLVYGNRDIIEYLPAYAVEAVDTTAAGDAFSGALAVAMAEGQPLGEACRFASAAGALAVTRRGAQSSMPFRREIERLISH